MKKTITYLFIIMIFMLFSLSLSGEEIGELRMSGIKMSHKLKSESVGLDCSFCHTIKEEDPRFVSFPDHATCGMCHYQEVDAENGGDCGFCHTSSDQETSVRRNIVLSPLVEFDHQRHEDKEVSCAECHETPELSLLKQNEMIPTMGTCVECHESRGVSKEEDCSSCHFEKYEYIEPLSHDNSWFDIHGHASKNASPDYNCSSCHTAEFDNSCLSCHHQNRLVGDEADCFRCHSTDVQNTPPPDHTPLWEESHGWGLSQDMIDNDCAVCHRASSGNDCISCHQGEAPRSHTTGFRLRGHAQLAYADRESCATCHSQSECITCHTTNPPMSHTGLWDAPNYRHCGFCHMEDNDYGAGGIEGNCGFCHESSATYANHTSEPGHTTGTCTICHSPGGSDGPSHPSPATVQSCESCHTM
jgi:hypothetical protein